MIKKPNFKKMKSERKIEEKYLDNLWARLVKLKAGNKCELCKKEEFLNSHHIYSRSKKCVRWDERNGISLCSGHHTLNSNFSAHKTPLDFIEWLREYRGETAYQQLRRIANTQQKIDKKLTTLYLEKEIEKIC